ncbi:hypothetical protein NLI96_g4332 [Meripilus lineatus]|uniref:Extracellular metalloproteinase n=1 Tax=Meripilus lineatus TaxID=2056292 RepID=A0AAD5VA58_9APHY|nr:hypothetical protein NLI96_g4332 [Physisporinus lineatus]
MTHQDATVPDFITGQYVTNKAKGIRSFPYSTDPSVNPLTYASLQDLGEVHDIGEVWANILHNVYAALVTDRGFYADGRTDPTSSAGNVVFLHNFIDALSLQPCNPTFIQARDAWLQADVNRYQGENQCTLWKAFASKGLGVNAGDYENDTTLPDEC